MQDIDFQAMSLDELWAFYEQILLLLTAKLETDKRELEQRLDRLRRAREFLQRGVVAAGLAKALSSSPLFASIDMVEDVLTMFTRHFEFQQNPAGAFFERLRAAGRSACALKSRRALG